jgi:2-oxoglutarate ferredoxin oxidoreductase subunit gamma
MGRKMIANIVMLGFFSSVTQAVSRRAVEEAVKDSVPKGTEEMNLNAFKKGWDYGAAMLKGREKKAAGHAGVAS